MEVVKGDRVRIKHGANTDLELIGGSFEDADGMTGTVTRVDPDDLWPYRVELDGRDSGFFPVYYSRDELEALR